MIAGMTALVLGVIAAILLAHAPAGSSLRNIDMAVSRSVVAHRSDTLSAIFGWATFLGSVWFLAPATVLVVALLALRRRFAAATLVGGAMTGSWILTSTLKNTVGRGRPDPSDVIGAINTGFAFPSGHTLNSAVFIGIISGLLITMSGVHRARVAVPVVAIPLAVLIGFSRIYLGYHWLSDVLGGWAVASGVLAVCWMLAVWWQGARQPSSGRDSPVGHTGRHA